MPRKPISAETLKQIVDDHLKEHGEEYGCEGGEVIYWDVDERGVFLGALIEV